MLEICIFDVFFQDQLFGSVPVAVICKMTARILGDFHGQYFGYLLPHSLATLFYSAIVVFENFYLFKCVESSKN